MGFLVIQRCEMRESEMQCFLDTRALKQASHQSKTLTLGRSRATQRATGAVGGYKRSSWVCRRGPAGAVATKGVLGDACAAGHRERSGMADGGARVPEVLARIVLEMVD